MPENERFQRNAAVKAQSVRAEATDGPRRDLQQEDSSVVMPHFGMYGSVSQSKGAYALLRGLDDGILNGLGSARWSCIDCFFKKWPVERIWLVKQREYLKLSIASQFLLRQTPVQECRIRPE